jgi:integrase/recombinase XerD
MASRASRRRGCLALGRKLVFRGTHWWIEFLPPDTKTREPIEVPWPEPLVAPLEAYLARHRGVLAQLRGGSMRSVGDALWISRHGLPLSKEMIYGCIRNRTFKDLGRAINPHLFRDCVATSIAIEDPRHVHIASCLLGHRKISTAEQYYNQARAIEASRLLQDVVLALRRGDDAPCSQVDHR